MKAIQTKFLGPTDIKGARIKAWAEGVGSVTISYPHECGEGDWMDANDDFAREGTHV